MAEAGDLESEKEAVVPLEEQQLPGAVRVLYTARGEERQEDQSDEVIQPLLQLNHQDNRDEDHRADTQTETDVPDPETAVPPELELAGGDQRGCSGSVRSLCSDSGRRECHICSEQFDSHTLLKCNHSLCKNCVDGIMRRAKDPGKLQCPFCRQTTPLPQWEIRRLQEEFLNNCVYDASSALVISPGPEPRVPRAGTSHTESDLSWLQPTSRCLFIIVTVVLGLVLLGCLVYLAFPFITILLLFGFS